MGLFEDWEGFDVQEERRNGGDIRIIEKACRKLKNGMEPERIANDLEEPLEHILEICELATKSEFEYDAEKLF